MSTTGAPDVRGPSFETIGAVLAPFPPDRHGFIERSVAFARTLHGGGFPFDEARVRGIAARSFDRAYHPGGVRRQLVAIWLSGDRTRGARRSCTCRRWSCTATPIRSCPSTAAAPPRAPSRARASRSSPAWATSCRAPVWPHVIDAVTKLAAERAVSEALVARAPIALPVRLHRQGRARGHRQRARLLGHADVAARACAARSIRRTCAPRSPTWRRAIRRCAAACRRSTAPIRSRARRFAYVEDPAFAVDGIFHVIDARDAGGARRARRTRSRTARSISSPTSRSR